MTGRVIVVGLGPGDPAQLTREAAEILAGAEVRFVRTRRHPSASEVGPAISFDDVYDAAATMDEVYTTIVRRLVEAAGREGTVIYAVPGSPLVAERTVELLREEPGIELDVRASLSFLDLAWARLGVDPVAAGVRLVDGHRFAVEAAGQSGPLLVAQADSSRVLSDIKLAVDDGPDVVVLQRLGLPDEAVTTLPWADLDRALVADHLTSVWIPGLAAPVAAELVGLDELVRTLRERCPWDRAQTHRSLTRHLLEETYEVLEAIDELSPGVSGTQEEGMAAEGEAADAGYEHLEEELGDLLFQVFLHAALAAEAGRFTVADVARGIHHKLVARHPHVFAGEDYGDDGSFGARWEQMKKIEKGRSSVMEGIPGNLPALLLASKVQRKAAAVGFDWADVSGAWEKIGEEVGELAQAMAAAPDPTPAGGDPAVIDELGDVLFSVVNVARHLDIDPETALHASATKFRHRFMAVEAMVAVRQGEGGAPPDLAGWDALWDEVKRAATAAGTSSTVSPTNNTSHISTSHNSSRHMSSSDRPTAIPRGPQDP
jgi:tetrapyrrole methylase family protein/MazG family protein